MPADAGLPGNEKSVEKVEPPISQTKTVVEVEERKPVPVESKSPERKADVSAPAASVPPEKPLVRKSVDYTSVLEMFNKFSGEKNPDTLMALFTKSSISGFSQAPPIVLSDGSSRLTIRIGPEIAGKEIPIFGLKGAKLVNFKLDQDGSFLMEILPEKDVNEADLEVMLNETITKIPLTVAQPLPLKPGRGDPITETDFRRFLGDQAKERQKAAGSSPQRRCLDEYIFTANYLVQLGRKDAPKAQDTGRAPGKDGESQAK
jgi:hypothetical protein